MQKYLKKFLSDTSHIIHTLQVHDAETSVRVDYNFDKREANIHWKGGIEKTGNGYQHFISWVILEEIKKTSDKYKISYSVGHTDSIELVIQVYIVEDEIQD